MIDINRNNYEEYILDFIEGNLSYSIENLFMSFLDQNPDIKAEIELYEEETISQDDLVYKNKSVLQKEDLLSGVASSNFDQLCIARIENDLTKKEASDFEQYIQKDAKKQKEFELYQLTKIKADKSIEFDGKYALRRTEKGFFRRNYFAIVSAAASVIILISLYVFVPKNNTNEIKAPIAKVTESASKVEQEKAAVEETDVAELQEEKKSDDSLQRLTVIQISEEKNEQTVEAQEIIMDQKEYSSLAQLEPIKVEYNFAQDNKQVDIVDIKTDIEIVQTNSQEEYISLKTYLASRVNKRVLNKKDKNKLQFFDIAQAGVEGINKLTGGKMTLERVYDEKGIAQKTEFNSRLVAFSAPIKKD